MHHRIVVSVLLATSLAGSGWSQSASEKLSSLNQAVKRELEEFPQAWPDGSPGVSSQVPSAFGGTYGVVGVGFGYQKKVRYGRNSDGVFSVLMPLGQPVGKLGVDVSASLLDLSDWDRYSADIKLHTRLGNTAFAVGYERALIYGWSDSDRSLYGAVSHIFHLKENRLDPLSRLTATLGVGNGRFRRESEVINDRGNLGVFGALSLNVHAQASVFGEWTGQDANVGVSLLPIRNRPLQLTLAASDIAGTAGDGTRFTMGVGYAIRF